MRTAYRRWEDMAMITYVLLAVFAAVPVYVWFKWAR